MIYVLCFFMLLCTLALLQELKELRTAIKEKDFTVSVTQPYILKTTPKQNDDTEKLDSIIDQVSVEDLRNDILNKTYNDPHRDVPPQVAVEKDGEWQWRSE